MAQMMVPAHWEAWEGGEVVGADLMVGPIKVAGYWRDSGLWFAHGTAGLQYNQDATARVFDSHDAARRAIEEAFGVVVVSEGD